MPLPSTKAEFLTSLRKAYEKLDAELADIGPERERDAGMEGDISCCDLIAYQIGWGRLLMSWEAEEKAGQKPVMPTEGYKWNQLGPLARTFYAEAENKSLGDLRKEFSELFGELCRWIESLSEKELLVPHQRKWTGEKWPMMKWVQVNTVAPYGSARAKIRRWKRLTSGSD